MFLILNFCVDGCVVVKMHLEGEGFGTDEGSEDSDCESGSGRAGGSAPDVQDDSKEGVKPESLPLLTVGSFSMYAYPRWQGRFLTL